MNYLNDSDSDVPRINPKDVDPEEITQRLLELDSKVPDPKYLPPFCVLIILVSILKQKIIKPYFFIYKYILLC